MKKKILSLYVLFLIFVSITGVSNASDVEVSRGGTSGIISDNGSIDQRVNALEHDVLQLEYLTRSSSAAGGVFILFGAFCALWAQGTRRNAWLWFFMGAIFSIISVLVLLYKNSKDLDNRALTG